MAASGTDLIVTEYYGHNVDTIDCHSITKSGPVINGNSPRMVIVKTDPGYGPAPGHTGTGTVVAVICPQ